MEKSKKDCLKDAVARMLTPLVAFLLEHGVAHREFADLAKRVFYEAGLATLKKRDARMTHSQLSVLTGLHRKDIAAFSKKTKTQDEYYYKESSPGAAVIAEWITHPLYLEKDGKPRPLPYADEAGNKTSFTGLVKSVSQDVRPKAHLEDLLRLKLVMQDNKGLLHLQEQAFLPNEDFRQKLEFFARHISDHLSAASINMQESPPPYFDRSAFHGELSPDAVQKLRALADKKGMELIKAVYRRAEELASDNKSPQSEARRMTFGIYLYDETEKPGAGSKKHGRKK
jgi:hypothetical protein